MFKWHGPDWTNHLTMYMIDPEHAMYDAARADEGWAYWDRLMGLGDEIVRTVVDAAGEGAAIALVSDHGGSTDYGAPRRDYLGDVLRELGLLVTGADGVDWTQTKAYPVGQYVHINVKERFPHGTVTLGDGEYCALRERIIEALLGTKTAKGGYAFRAVLPIEAAARLGVDHAMAGDIFVIPGPPEKLSKEEFYALYPDPGTRGTWDWPRLNSGGHSDDSYFVLSGPGVPRGYRRTRPTLITSVAPTLATTLGIPVPRDADGAVLWDFVE